MADSSKTERRPDHSGRFPTVSSQSGLVTVQDGVFLVLTQAFDGHGNSLIHENGAVFDGFPGVSLWIETPAGRGGELTLSPIHGDARRIGFSKISEGDKCRLYGIKGGEELDKEGPCSCAGGTYHRIYLTPHLDRGEIALICDVWGCQRSRVIDDRDLLSWIDY